MSIIKKILEERAAENLVELDEDAESALAKKSKESGVSLSILKTVYRRGVAAWNSGHRPGTTPQQWGMARVNSYITKGKGTYHGADKDLREDLDKDSRLTNKKYQKGMDKETAAARVAHWKKMDKLSDRDPRAYEPAPGDATAKTKESKHTKKYRELYGEGMSPQEKLARVQERLRKQLNHPHPDYYKDLRSAYDIKDDRERIEKIVDIKKKYQVKEAFYIEDLDEQIKMLDEMPGANMDTRAVHQHLKKAGWSLTRTSGGHDIYTHPDAKHNIPVPRHRQLKAPLVLGILKSSKLRKEEKEVDELDTSDYKVDKAGRKYKAHKIVFNKGEEDMKEELKGNQHKLDVDKDGKIEGEDLAKLRKMKKEETELDEASVKYFMGRYEVHHKGEHVATYPEKFVAQDHANSLNDRAKLEAQKRKKPKQELDERELSDAEMKERERIVKGMKKSYKDFKSQYGSRAKSVMYATATKLAKEEFSEDFLEELEQIDEASNYKKVAVKSLEDFKKHAEKHGYTVQKVSDDHHQAWREGPHGGAHLAGVHFGGDNKYKAEKWMRIPKTVKEETEQIDEISKGTLASYIKKASVNALSSGVSAGGTMASGDYKKGGQRLDKGFKRTVGISKAVDRLAKEEVELDEEIKPYVSGGHGEGWSILDHSGKEVKKFHWKDYMDHPIKDKRKAAKDDAMAYLKKHFNSLRKPTNECVEEHLLDLCEAMIERDDFDDRVAAYKKAGHRVLDTKYSDMKAHISFVDPEGMHRTVKYTPTGKSMQNHGQYGGGEKDESGEKVNKSEVKTVKRGRGRPRKDKFAESVDILLSLTEEEFDEIMEGSSLDEIVESLCNLSEEELKELKGE